MVWAPAGELAAHDRSRQGRDRDQRGEIEPCLMLGSAAALAAALTHDDGLQTWPVMSFLQPCDIMDHRRGAGFDPAVIAIDGGVAGDPCVGEVARLLLRGEQFDVGAQRALVALQGQHVVGLAGAYRPGDPALTAHGVGRHDRALDGRHGQQPGDCRGLVGLVRRLDLAEHEPLAGGESGHHVDRRLIVSLAAGSARGLAVHGDHLGGHARHRSDPGDEAALKLRRIQCREDVADPVVRRRAVLERAEPPQQGQLLLAEPGDVGERFRPRQGRKQGQQQHLIERRDHLASLAAVRRVSAMARKDRRLEDLPIGPG